MTRPNRRVRAAFRLRGARALAAAALVATSARCGGSAHSGDAPVSLRGRVLADTVVFAFPEGIVVTDRVVAVQDDHPPPALRIFDRGGRPLGQVGRRGSGPGEFVQPLDVFGRPGHASELWVYDSRLSRLTPYVVDHGGSPGLRPRGDPVPLSAPLLLESPRWIDDSTVVALSPMLNAGERRFVLFGANGVQRGSVGEEPPGGSQIRGIVRQQAYGGKIAVHPDRPWFVLASRYAGRLDVYDRNGTRVRALRVPERFDPDFSQARDGVNMVRGPHFRFGYIDVAATGRRVYGLYSGRKSDEAGPNYGRLVHVFDWDGRLLRVFGLDRAVFRIAVDPAGEALYALQLEPQPQLIAYDLPTVPAKEAMR